uniref:Uncharacterized protein n=1 Tax=Anopheles christyi TaxID=43041 RepID=A0A182KIL2_9DIPT
MFAYIRSLGDETVSPTDFWTVRGYESYSNFRASDLRLPISGFVSVCRTNKMGLGGGGL